MSKGKQSSECSAIEKAAQGPRSIGVVPSRTKSRVNSARKGLSTSSMSYRWQTFKRRLNEPPPFSNRKTGEFEGEEHVDQAVAGSVDTSLSDFVRFDSIGLGCLTSSDAIAL
jgi:hypothetical protein